MAKNNKKVKYYITKDGEFVIENYNFSRPFANFFPGIAGEHGIPMWVFYVNRGQGISSFGTKDKDHSILEFFPANKAWQFTPMRGFRTFLKISSGENFKFYEPFHNGFVNLTYNLSNRMLISSSGLRIEENNFSLGLKVGVEYFNIPNDSFAGLARILTVENTSSDKKIELIDGLPQIVPYGTSNLFLKKLNRTIEAWMKVKNMEKSVPFYKLDVDPTDRPEVIHIRGGNFYLAFHSQKNKTNIIKPIIDPESIFGEVTDFSCPRLFIEKRDFSPPKTETVESRTPCAFIFQKLNLKKKETKDIFSIIGCMRSQEILNSTLPRIKTIGYLNQKRKENILLIKGLENNILTESGLSKFNLYAKQTYLDNILRGGYPLVFDKSKTVFYIYSRKHGDLERDYNKFTLNPTYYSQGNGNYRDANQNCRLDVWFNPLVKEENIFKFFNLIQTDGYNPLVVKGSFFILKDADGFKERFSGQIGSEAMDKLVDFLLKPFNPGEVVFFIEENKIKLKTELKDFLDALFLYCEKHFDAEHSEGFWTDHWSYNLDLLESYLGIYPEKLKTLIFHTKEFTYFDNTEVVRPRSEKYMLYNGKPRQLHSVTCDNLKKELIKKRKSLPHIVRTENGKGQIHKCTLIEKLLCILGNKLTSLDPFGIGIEMEADKPNWYDALNGLPALFGSSVCETIELKRLVNLIIDSIEKAEIDNIHLAQEMAELLREINKSINEYLEDNNDKKDFVFWDKTHALKEEYRIKTRLGLSGRESSFSKTELEKILKNILSKIEAGIKEAFDKNINIIYSYFINQVEEYDLVRDHFIKPTRFKQIKVPFFLEGQMHALRTAEDKNGAKSLFQATRKSPLFDRKLNMYKVTANLKSMPEEIGRCRVFPPGWLENESIWLHMEYKYLLETLKQGLFDEFFVDFKNALIPFQKPEAYGRSILENSSFLVSSAFADKKFHGNGFVARLSGSTAEFLQMWLIMNAGKTPFFLNENNELNLRFNPALPRWLFDSNGNYGFNFLSKIKVAYHNKNRKDTFGKNAALIKKIIFEDKDSKKVTLTSDIIPSPYAEQIRSCQVKSIDIFLE